MTALLDAHIARAQEALAKDRPHIAAELFGVALSLSADPVSRITCLTGLDRALLAIGRHEEADYQWKFALLSGYQRPDYLIPMIIGALSVERPDIARERLNSVMADLDTGLAWQLSHRILLAADETKAANDQLEKKALEMPPTVFAVYKAKILLAEQRYREVLNLFSDGLSGKSYDLLRLRIRALRGLGRYDQLEELLKAQREFYPDDTYIDEELAHNATSLRNRQLSVDRWEKLVRLSGGSLSNLRAYVEALLANIEVDRARKIIAEAEASDTFPMHALRSLSARVETAVSEHDKALAIINGAIEEFESKISAISMGRLWLELGAVSLSKYWLDGGQHWIEQYLAATRMACDKNPGNVRQKVSLVNALVRANRPEEACALIETLPDTKRPEILRARMWHSHYISDHERTRLLWNLRTRFHYIPQIENGQKAQLTRLDENPLPKPDTVTLYSLVHDERRRLPWFFDYYRSLGIAHFVMIDNASTDGSSEYLQEQSDVTLYTTKDNFAAAFDGIVWINHLKSKLSPRGWTLYVDMDEALVYDECETRSVPDLVEKLEIEGAEAFPTYMLDMFSKISVSGQHNDETEINYTNQYREYLDEIISAPSVTCPYKSYFGGVRSVFGVKHELTKTPLIKNSAGIIFMRSSHDISPGKIAQNYGVLLHYKMTDGLASQAYAVLEDKTRSINCHLRYRKYSEAGDYAELLDPITARAKTYNGSFSLVKEGVIPNLGWA